VNSLQWNSFYLGVWNGLTPISDEEAARQYRAAEKPRTATATHLFSAA
jgi:hypothetical protein